MVIQKPDRTEGGAALAVALHVLLLLLVLGQVVYLASRYRVRVDMTSDKLWTSTPSTRRLLEKLDDRLVVEAYFSPKEGLPLAMSGSRDWADNFLDEITQIGRGRVVVQRFDPNSDKSVADTATRLGIKPLNLSSRSATSLSVDQHWQGLRLLYGGGKQKVLSAFLPRSSFEAEALVTPKIKEVLTGKRKRFGYMEWPDRIGNPRQQRSAGWGTVRTHEGLKTRYEFQNFKDEDGALLPDDLTTLFLFRPKDLTDRQKYVMDQFLLGGGTLVIFADAAEYQIATQRRFAKTSISIDAKDSVYPFVEQLAHYGIEWKTKLLADMQQDSYTARFGMPQEYFSVPIRAQTGATQYAPVSYPYFFHAVNVDWATVADQLAVDLAGKIDERMAEQYRKTLKPGMPEDDFLFQGFKKQGNRGPGFYWPTWVGLRQRAGGSVDLPDGVSGRVLLWSSPLVLLEDPPQQVDPVGRDERQMKGVHDAFINKLSERTRAEPRLQAPLMAEVIGDFTSFFASKERPRRPSEIREDGGNGKSDAERDDPAVNKSGNEAVESGSDVGPQPAPDAVVSEDPGERAMRKKAVAPGRIVIIGDATFLRDDVLRGDYQRSGGPVSGGTGMPFFAQMLDWLSDDRDLVALQTRVPADRTIALVASDSQPNADPRDAEQALRTKTSWLVWVNVIVPSLLLSAFGFVLWLIRRNQKRAFLATLS
jgi:ABC-type uncharacterized transport system involved in gliding motility auxiliary subunit